MKKYLISIGCLLALCLGSIQADAKEYSQGATDAYNKGIRQYQQKAYYSAISSFEQAVKIEPEFSDAYYNMASIFDQLKQYEKAIEAYSQVLKINPEDYDTIYALAKICYKKGNYSTTIKYVKFLPQSYENYAAAAKLSEESEKLLEEQKERMNRTKINISDPNKRIIIDQFSSPTGIAIDSGGNLYVACYSDNSIMKVDKDKKVSLFIKNPQLNGPIGLAIDKFDNVYVANYENNNILKIAPNGRVYVFMDKVYKPYYLLINNDTLYVSEQTNNVIIKYDLQ